MRGAKAAAVAETAFSTIGVKSFSRVEHVEHVDLAVNSLRRGATQPPVARRDARPLPWRRGFQPRCPLNILAYNLTIIPSHCFRYLEFWSIGGLEIQTRSPKLRNSPLQKQSIVAVETRGA